MYTDSHCHITCDRLYSRIDEIIENIKTKNITSCMIMCTSPEELERAKKLKEKYPFFKVAFGWFPSDAKEIKEKENIDFTIVNGENRPSFYRYRRSGIGLLLGYKF